MATKKQIAEQALRILSGGTPHVDREIDIREIMLYLDQLRDNRCRIDALNGIKQGIYDISSDYLTQYENVDIQTDTTRNQRYITLPASVIDLPNEMGVYQITSMQNPEVAFYRIPSLSAPLYRGKPAINIDVNTYYWTVGQKAWFKNIDKMVDKLFVTLVASSKDIAENANYPVPPDVEAELLELLVKAFSILQQAPHDEIEDGIK
jgi:hypothetical protein